MNIRDIILDFQESNVMIDNSRDCLSENTNQSIQISKSLIIQSENKTFLSTTLYNENIKNLINSFKQSDDPEVTINQLRELISIIPWDITRNDCMNFFHIHRLLSQKGLMALGIRFTVQYNLYAGTILHLGSDEQKIWVKNNTDIGCFALTEQSAGVSSGLVINTNAYYEPFSKTFKLKSNTIEDSKYWISQGLLAKYAVVFANLHIDKINYGPHGFLVDLSEIKKQNGLHITDMGTKTVANGLDNAKIYFDVSIPETCLLSRFTKIVNGVYLRDKKYSFLTVAIRLLTGRYAIATSAHSYYSQILEKFEKIAVDRKIFITNKNLKSISELPEFSSYLSKCKDWEKKIGIYNRYVEDNIKIHIENDIDFPDWLIESISISKIISTTIPVISITILRRLLGSQSLIYDNMLHDKVLDIFLMTAFAEGSNDLLKQKITRDVVFQLKDNLLYALSKPYYLWTFAKLLIDLYTKTNKVDAWFDNYDKIIAFAHDRILEKTGINMDLLSLTYPTKSRL